MKIKLLIILCCAFGIYSYSQNISFPDANFKKALLDHGSSVTGSNIGKIDTNNDGEISENEAKVYAKGIKIGGYKVTNISGIEYFKSITYFSGGTYLTEADFSENTKLETLVCGGKYLKSLNITKNTALISLTTRKTQLTSLDISQNTKLEVLNLEENRLKTVNLLNTTALISLYLNDNALTSLDLSKLTALRNLELENNNLSQIDVSKNTALEHIKLRNNKLRNLTVQYNRALTFLDCQYNLLGVLNVANGKNSDLEVIAKNNPSLSCIQIDANFTPPSYWEKDAGASFNSNCAIALTGGNPNGAPKCEEAPALTYFKGFYQTTEWMKSVAPKMGTGTASMFYKFSAPQSAKAGNRRLTIRSCSVDRSRGTLYVGSGSCDNLDQEAKFAKSCSNSSSGRSYFNGEVTAGRSYTIEWNSRPPSGGVGGDDPFFWEWKYDSPETCNPPKIDDVVYNTATNEAEVTFTDENATGTTTGTYEVYIVNVEKEEYLVLGKPDMIVKKSPFKIRGLQKNTSYRLYISANCTNGMKSGFEYLQDGYGVSTYSNDAPTNDNLCNATVITIGEKTSPNNYFTESATKETNEPFGSCFSEANQTVWFKFIAPPSGKVKITTDFETQSVLSFDVEMSLYGKPSDCKDLTTLGKALACDNDSGTTGDGKKAVLTHAKLTPGAEYYVQIGGDSGGAFGIEIHELPADDQKEAAKLNLNEAAKQFDLTEATDSGIATNCGTPLLDYWISFIAPSSGKVTIAATTNTNKIAKLDLFYLDTGNVLKSLGVCGNNNLSFRKAGNEQRSALNGLTPNQEYFIKVFTEAGSEFNTFTMRIEDPAKLAVEDVVKQQALLYPNPVSTTLHISLQNNETIKEVVFYTMLGREVYNLKIAQRSETTINVSKLPTGMYIIKTRGEERMYTNKLFIK